MALAMAPDGDGPESYAQFYGSFLLGLCLDGQAPLGWSAIGISPSLGPPPPLPDTRPGSGHSQVSTSSLGPGYLAPIAPAAVPDEAPQEAANAAPLDLGLSSLFGDLPFELQWDVPQNEVAPSLDWLLNDNTAAGDSALWGFGSDWAGNAGWNVDLTNFRS